MTHPTPMDLQEKCYHSNCSIVCSNSTQPLERYPSAEVVAVPRSLSPISIATGAVNALFLYKPFFNFAAGQAKSMIVKRGSEIGYPWAPELANLQLHDWSSELEAVQNLSVTYPDVWATINYVLRRTHTVILFLFCMFLTPICVQYYLKPFHAYEMGNLSWDAALEVELAAKSVHANVFDPEVHRFVTFFFVGALKHGVFFIKVLSFVFVEEETWSKWWCKITRRLSWKINLNAEIQAHEYCWYRMCIGAQHLWAVWG